MANRLILAGALLIAAGPAAAQPRNKPSVGVRLRGCKQGLDYGRWHDRIKAVYELGEMGGAATPLLCYATNDADWQVRLAAVHFLGKSGTEAVAVLGDVANREPCPHIRLSALRWLQSMGGEGEAMYRSVLTPEDEHALKTMPGRVGLDRMGKPLAMDVDGKTASSFLRGGIDLRVCATSEYSGQYQKEPRCPRQAQPQAFPQEERLASVPAVTETAPSASPASAPPAVSPSVSQAAPPKPETPEQKRLNEEVDKFLEPGQSESLPEGGPGLARSWLEPPPVVLQSQPRRPADPAALRPSLGPREELPPVPLAPRHETLVGAPPAVPVDAGTLKPDGDPIPALIAQLSSADPRQRARAADELGKRGGAAEPAVAALRSALSDRDRRVRSSAALALGGIGVSSEGIIADLEPLLDDKDEDVRFSAGLSISRLKAPGVRG